MKTYFSFVNSKSIAANDMYTSLHKQKHRTTNFPHVTTEHSLLANWWVCAYGMGESTVFALVGRKNNYVRADISSHVV